MLNLHEAHLLAGEIDDKETALGGYVYHNVLATAPFSP